MQSSFTEIVLKSIADAAKLFLFEYNGDAFAGMKIPTGSTVDTMIRVAAKGLLMILCMAASLCTSFLLINIFLSRIASRNSFKKAISQFRKTPSKQIYIFWGINDHVAILAESIKKGPDPNPFILFIDNPKNENPDETSFWRRLVNFSISPNKRLLGNEETGEYCVADYRISEFYNYGIKQTSSDSGQNKSDVFSSMNLEDVKRLLDSIQENGTMVHIFFLEEKENANIKAVNVLRQDKTIKSLTTKGIIVKIYCHARHDSINRVIEDTSLESGIIIKTIDSSYLAIEQLKQEGDWHPVKFVEISEENPGTVSSPFTSLVIGFGQTGRDAVRFLYEFGAFVDCRSTDDKVKRSPFECHVVDPDMANIEGKFIASSPHVNIFPSHEEHPGFISSDSNIFLHNFNSSSYFFYKNILSRIACKLNYVILATGDDETNITAAVDILEYVYKNGNDLPSRFHIFIRSYKKSEFLNDIAEHYNDIMGYTIMTIFGQPEKIYTYDLIINDNNEKQAQRFYDAYNKTLGKVSQFMSYGSWSERKNFELKRTIREIKTSVKPITGNMTIDDSEVDDYGIQTMFCKN